MKVRSVEWPANRFDLRRPLLLPPKPFGQTVDAGGQMSAIGAERKAQPVCHSLLFWGRMEIGQIKIPVQPLVALTREQRLSGLRHQGSERLWTCGARLRACQESRAQQRVLSEQIGLSVMTKRVLDRAFEIGACQQRCDSRAARRGVSSADAIPDTRLPVNQTASGSGRLNTLVPAGFEQKSNRFWRGMRAANRPTSARKQTRR